MSPSIGAPLVTFTKVVGFNSTAFDILSNVNPAEASAGEDRLKPLCAVPGQEAQGTTLPSRDHRCLPADQQGRNPGSRGR